MIQKKKKKSDSHSLVANELNIYKYVLSLVIWYAVQAEINVVSKNLQRSINVHQNLANILLN